MWTALVIAVLGGGGLQALVSQVAGRRRAAADTQHVFAEVDQVIVSTYGSMLEHIRTEVHDLREENKRLRSRVADLEFQIVEVRQKLAAEEMSTAMLRAQVNDLGHEPDA